MEYANATDRDVISAFYTDKCFLKIKQCLSIGKIIFSFVELANPKDNIDVFMDAEEFGAILMNGIKTGRLLKTLEDEKQKTPNGGYPNSIYTSPIGGTNKDAIYGVVSRYYTIAPGAKADVVFTAYKHKATKNEKGAYIANRNEKPVNKIFVPCTYNDLRILQYKWSFLEANYMSAKYTIENMTPIFQKNLDTEPTQAMYSLQEDEPVGGKKENESVNVTTTDEETVSLSCIVSSVPTYHTAQNMYSVSIRDDKTQPIGTLYIRGENYSSNIVNGVKLQILATKKGNNYLYLEPIAS